jgi:competence protein ComEC
MHILSVSGLHAGIIYAIILLILKPIRSLAWSRWIVAGISLICLWAYAFVTGLSPSVLRAVMMFSFMVVAKPFGRNTHIYNTLAASAFLLLFYNPFLILSVGFQLSYLAVLGIVCLQRPLYNLWEPTSVIWDKLWQITCVSLAAQLATFALGLFYFHQFPVYFLISNLLVVPLSTAVLVVGIALLAVSPFDFVASVVAWIIELLIRILNGIVFFIEGLPFSVIGSVHITFLQCWLLMAMAVFFILLFQRRRFYFGLVVAGISLIFGLQDWMHYFTEVRKDQLVVYDVPGHSVVNRIYNGHSRLYSDSSLLADGRQIRYHLQPYWIQSGTKDFYSSRIDSSMNAMHPGFRCFLWNKQRILCIEQPKADLPNVIETDYLMIGNNAIGSIVDLKGKIRFKQLILLSSNTNRFTDRIIQEAADNKILLYSVRKNGALILNL